MKHPDLRRVMRLKEVIMLCGLSRSSIYSYIADGKFPQSRKIGSQAVGWDSREIERWIDDRLGAREWKPSPERRDLVSLTNRIDSLVCGIEVDFDAPLSPDDE